MDESILAEIFENYRNIYKGVFLDSQVFLLLYCSCKYNVDIRS
jgi:hypothetical protein